MRHALGRVLLLYVRSATRLSFRIFAPHGGFLPAYEPTLDYFGIARGLIGIIALLIVDAIYGADLGGVQNFPLMPPSLTDSWAFIGAFGAILSLVLVTLLWTRRGHRLRAAKQLWYPVRSVIALLVLSLAVPPIMSILIHPLSQSVMLHLMAQLLFLLAIGWYLIFLWCAVWCCAAGPFRAGDGHPLLAPATAVVLAWLAAVHALAASRPLPGMSETTLLIISICGPATVTILAGLEIWILHSKFPGQFPFRDGPLDPELRAVDLRGRARTIEAIGQRLGKLGGQLKESVAQFIHANP
jgi:hypothetical protein